MAGEGLFDSSLVASGWFDETASVRGWFDTSLLAAAGGVSHDVSATEAASSADSPSAGVSVSAGSTESANGGDVADVVIVRAATQSETAAPSDAQSNTALRAATQSESATPSDTQNRVLTTLASGAESTTAADSAVGGTSIADEVLESTAVWSTQYPDARNIWPYAEDLAGAVAALPCDIPAGWTITHGHLAPDGSYTASYLYNGTGADSQVRIGLEPYPKATAETISTSFFVKGDGTEFTAWDVSTMFSSCGVVFYSDGTAGSDGSSGHHPYYVTYDAITPEGNGFYRVETSLGVGAALEDLSMYPVAHRVGVNLPPDHGIYLWGLQIVPQLTTESWLPQPTWSVGVSNDIPSEGLLTFYPAWSRVTDSGTITYQGVDYHHLASIEGEYISVEFVDLTRPAGYYVYDVELNIKLPAGGFASLYVSDADGFILSSTGVVSELPGAPLPSVSVTDLGSGYFRVSWSPNLANAPWEGASLWVNMRDEFGSWLAGGATATEFYVSDVRYNGVQETDPLDASDTSVAHSTLADTAETTTPTDTQSNNALLLADKTETTEAASAESAAGVFPVARTEPTTSADSQTGNFVATGAATETGSGADSSSNTAAFSAAGTDSATASTVQDRAITFTASGTESSAPADTQSNVAVLVSASTEAATGADSQDRAGSYAGSASETGVAADVQDRANLVTASGAESGAGSDVQTTVAAFSTALAEAVAAADSPVGAYSTGVSGTESAAASETQSNVAVLLASGTDSTVSTDASAVSSSITAGATDTTTPTEVQSSAAAFPTTGSEAGTATDSEDGTRQSNAFSGTVNDQTTAAASETALASFPVSASDGVMASDVVAAIQVALAGTLEALTALDSTAAGASVTGQTAEATAPSDSPAATRAIDRAVSEVATGLDIQSALGVLNAYVAEMIAATDDLSAVGVLTAGAVEVVTADDLSIGGRVVWADVVVVTDATDLATAQFFTLVESLGFSRHSVRFIGKNAYIFSTLDHVPVLTKEQHAIAETQGLRVVARPTKQVAYASRKQRVSSIKSTY